LTTCFGREHLADDEPVEQHADRGQMLLDGRLRGVALLDGAIARVRHLQRLQIGGDVKRLDIGELPDAMLLEPGEERARRPVIGQAGVIVLDRSGEEIEEPLCGTVAGPGDHRRHRQRTAQGRRRNRRPMFRWQSPVGAHRDTL
jgi:hypothetical protein